MKEIVKGALVKLLVPCLVLLNCPVYGAVEEGQPATPTTEVVHKAPAEAEAGKRITLDAEVQDPQGVDVVRVYFKAEEAANYNFVPMDNVDGGDMYVATLPAPANGAKSVEYLILVKNSTNVVVKTQTYTLTVKDSEQMAGAGEPIKVYSEMAEVPTEMTGFSDNIAFDLVESGAKFGVVAGLYSSMTAGGGGAVSGGTIAASVGGISTTTLVVAGVAAAAAVGGVAAAGGGGSSDGSSSSSTASATCNSSTTSGSDSPETHTIALGQSSGVFAFSWSNGGSIPDRMVVSVGGQTVYDTGCTAGTGSANVSFSGGSIATVNVTPNCDGTTSGTYWEFTVGCP